MAFLFGPGAGGGGGGTNQEDYNWPATTITADYTATESDYNIFVDTSGGAVTITFPDPSTFTNPRREFRVIIKDGSNSTFIDAGVGTTIDTQPSGSPTELFTAKIITSDGSDYFTI